jgi:hypothetical protein
MKRKIALVLAALYFVGVAFNLVEDFVRYRQERLFLGQPSADSAIAIIGSTLATATAGWLVVVLVKSIRRGSVQFSGWERLGASLIRGSGNLCMYAVAVVVGFSALLTLTEAPDLVEAFVLLADRFSPLHWANLVVLFLLCLPSMGLWRLADSLDRRLQPTF